MLKVLPCLTNYILILLHHTNVTFKSFSYIYKDTFRTSIALNQQKQRRRYKKVCYVTHKQIFRLIDVHIKTIFKINLLKIIRDTSKN